MRLPIGIFSLPEVSSARPDQGHGKKRALQKIAKFLSVAIPWDFNEMVFLSDPSKADKIWWAFHLEKCNGKPFFPDNPDLVIFWTLPFMVGAFCDGSRSR